MSSLRIERVLALPEPLVANTIYIVKRSEYGLADVYFTSADGQEARHVLSKEDVTDAVSAAMRQYNNIRMVSDIVARDQLNLSYNAMIYVQDATLDSSVRLGGALYFYNVQNGSFTKMCEFESMDVIASWDTLQNKPSSSVAQIDAAVQASHSHTNITVLNALDDTGSGLTYNGKPVMTVVRDEW